ncbi:FAD/NAD(P)-binding domain-containing protein [Choiromyces venosus 120613-1]|uniref:FAD/NAD(P)-binding domain-containing protein n=1 Tax=Choiromyces venosus 120613-1 TaxID=1336337 RepID=A0A3N4K7Z4_9PEZI|nr:FAD/NAD(P)-binding domain-containing protein [Choiromyces venosus 120613-1]
MSPPKYTDVICIGVGLSGIALGARLKTHYPDASAHFYDRNTDLGGTWHVNTYPGAACDVPSALYSFSFAMSAAWSCMTPSQTEIKEYALGVAREYGIPERMTLGAEVSGCEWVEGRGVWKVKVAREGEEWEHECKVLFSAVGGLVYPNVPKVEGMEEFEGRICHSAEWDPEIDLEGKDVVVVGNGCTAAQIVPAVAEVAASVTQIVRSAHWLVKAPNINYTPRIQWILRNIPLVNRLHRFLIFLAIEESFRLFGNSESSKKYRGKRRPVLERYMREASPEKYHDILIPDFEVGCKRRVLDADYLKTLHKPHVTMTKSPITRITSTGIQTSPSPTSSSTPDHHKAQVIIFATGFKTNYFPLQIIGKHATSMHSHFSTLGGPGAYKTTAMSGFPNFFMLFGPNAATGHTSALMAIENTVEYAMRVLRPVLGGKRGSRAVAVEVKMEKEREWVLNVQRELEGMVWKSGCKTWYNNESGWNAVTYPWSQTHFWWHSLWVKWGDWIVTITNDNSITTHHLPNQARTYSC